MTLLAEARRRSTVRLASAALVTLCVLAAAMPARAFCGFYVSGADAKLFNDATMVVLMRDGTRTALSMQNEYQGPPKDFALVIPVPVVLQEENVKTLPREVFQRVDTAAAPRLVEYWEQDPCPPPRMPDLNPMKYKMEAASAPMSASGGVKVEAEFAVGEYEVVILSAEDSMGLDTWLRDQSYNIPEGAEEVLRPYVQNDMKFFAAKVDPQKVTFEEGRARLSPLRFHYDDDAFSLPVRLGLLNSQGTQDVIVHILAQERYEAANFPNVTIPTNLDVAESARDQFGAFYSDLFSRTVEQNPGAVITEYAWQASSCDPCPAPSLNDAELKLLGADVMPSMKDLDDWRLASEFVLTRLHARYGKDLSEDLVFKAAEPIAGGREWRGPDKKLEHGSRPFSSNMFQGRYAIRHPWKGPITCLDPKRGRWGGPPDGGGRKISAARDAAFARPESVDLASFLLSDVPELDLVAAGAAVSPAPTGSGPIQRIAMAAVLLGLVGGGVYAIRRWRRRKKG